MATLYITEFSSVAASPTPGGGKVLLLPGDVDQTVAIAAGSAQSAAFGANTRFVRVMADVVCSVLVGANPTATAAKMRLAANVPEVFGVTAGQKIAVITNT